MTVETTGYQGASQPAVASHYDLPTEFFALWLDPTMTYTCALWAPGDTLETAQVRKMDHLLDGLRLTRGSRLLDVGCGWGGLAARAVRTRGVATAVGLTLSPGQAAAADERVGAEVSVRLENWIDHEPAQPYDAIVSVGAFEHFARPGLTTAQVLAAYRRFFVFCRSALRPGARLALQTNIKGNNTRMDRRTAADMAFVADRIFPESRIPSLAEVLAGGERLFDVVGLRNDPEHYALTCRSWLAGLRAHREAATRMVGADVVADYERFLSSSVGHFRNRHLGLARIILEAV